MAGKSAWFSLALSFILFQGIRSQAVTDFTNYPANSRGCLTSAASSSKCPTDTVPNFNGCVCSNGGGFVQSAVQCLTASDAGDLGGVYATMSSNCANSNTPLPYTLQQFLALGGSGTTTPANNPSTTTVTGVTTVSQQGTTKVQTFVSTVTPGLTTSAVLTTVVVTPTGSGQATPFTSVITLVGGVPTSTSPSGNGGDSGNSNGNSSKLSTTAIIGMAVGIPLFFALVGLIGTLCWCQRRRERKQHAAVAPMAPAGGQVAPMPAYAPAQSQSSRPQSSVTTFTNTPAPAMAYENKLAQQNRFSNMSYQKPVSPDQRWSQLHPQQQQAPGALPYTKSPSPPVQQSWQNTPSPQPNWPQQQQQQHPGAMYGGGGVPPGASELPANVQSPTYAQELPAQHPYGYQ